MPRGGLGLRHDERSRLAGLRPFTPVIAVVMGFATYGCCRYVNGGTAQGTAVIGGRPVKYSSMNASRDLCS